MFKNPQGGHAGRLIDECGLKGTRVGDAEVSSVHANFFINLGGATARDVRALIEQVRETVERRTGVSLESEVVTWN
jgi:UDP-N-acetylmuramate dehydrogenase